MDVAGLRRSRCLEPKDLLGRSSDEIRTLSESQGQPQRSKQIQRMIATIYDSGFEEAHDTYNALSVDRDGGVWYVLSSTSPDQGGKLFRLHPGESQPREVVDLTEACGEAGWNSYPQGKSHSRFFEWDGALWSSTHAGYYETVDGMERMPKTPMEGYRHYPGGHFLRIDPATECVRSVGVAPHGEGILAMTQDPVRGTLYGISWPTGHLLRLDPGDGAVEDLGWVDAHGEAGIPGETYRPLCRALLVEPDSGDLWYSTADGTLWTLKQGAEKPEASRQVSMRRDYFGSFDPTRPGSMAWNWRQVVRDANRHCAWGTHGNSGYLFRFDPKKETLELIERITSDASRRIGMTDQFSYGYLGLELGPDGKTLYHLTGSPLFDDKGQPVGGEAIAKGGARGPEELHLVTWDIESAERTDHGPIRLESGERPSHVNSLAISSDGWIYSMSRLERNGRVVQDLIRFRDPLAG